MQTYTHLAIGSLAGVVVFPHNHWAQAAVVAGSIVPDMVSMAKFAWDQKQGVRPFTRQSARLLILKEISHSIPAWLLLGWLATILLPGSNFLPIIRAFTIGGIIHEIVDGATHNDKRYRDTDCTMLWPIPFRLSDLIGVWEYRYDFGVLRPKPLEAAVLIIVAATAVLLHLR